MRRLFFLLPNREVCKTVVDELKECGTPISHLHVVASVAQRLDGLPEADIWDRTEMKRGLEWGIGLGGVAGLFGGLLAVAFPPGGLVLGGGALLSGAAAGAGFGGVVSMLMKSDEPNHELDDFREELESGALLLMVDVPKERVDPVAELITSRYPEGYVRITTIPKRSPKEPAQVLDPQGKAA